MKGFTGDFCQKVDCPDPTCSEHGFCVDGSCICKKGWKGLDCGILDEEARQCLPDCSGHGVLTSRLKNVIASMAGLATIVVPNCATWIADLMEGKKHKKKNYQHFCSK